MSSSMAAPSPKDGNLSQWVSQVQERHRSNGGGIGDIGTREPINSTSSSSAAQLEEEIRKSREDRAKRRSHTGGVLSPISTGNNTSITPVTATTGTPSGEETLRKLLGERGLASPSAEMKTAYLPPSLVSSSPPKRSNTLLDRYGGAVGPTGVAKPGSKDAPASLASFMGGKASGPRLGKLEGDGRSAPPEAHLIDDTIRRPMPGMTGGGLASFLEARANSNSARLPAVSPPLTSNQAVPSSSSSSSRPTPNRTESMERAHLTTNTTQTEDYTSERNDRATSPLKASQVSATKEITPTQYHLSKEQTSIASPTSLAPASLVHSPTSDALRGGFISPPQNAPAVNNVATSFSSQSSQQTVDKLPSASLTRLRSKKMVEQRVREAQERTSTDPGPTTTSPSIRSAPAWMSSTPKPPAEVSSAKANWSSTDTDHSSHVVEKKSPFIPGKFGNALPGMSQSSAVPSRNLYASNNRNNDQEKTDAYAAPVRLPGMGSAQSPFTSRQATAEMEDSKDGIAQPLEQLTKGRAKPKRTARSSGTAALLTVELENNDARVEEQVSEERISMVDFSTARATFGGAAPGRSVSPIKSSTGLHVDTAVPSTTLRKDSVPDSAERRIADSTAALEALLEGKTVKTPTFEASRASYIPEQKKRTGTLQIAKNKDSHITIDTTSVLRSSAKLGVGSTRKIVSVDVVSIGSDGIMTKLEGEQGRILYETETQVITTRFKESVASGLVVTKVFARTGRMSSLLTEPTCIEARKVQEIGKQQRVEIIDARQGRESTELVKLLGSGYIVTREGSRKHYEAQGTFLYDVRGSEGVHYIDQVDMLTSSLCSAHSAVICLMEDVFVWHGIGSTSSIRQTALHYAQQLRGSLHQKSTITEYEEGEEDELFWTCFDKSGLYANAWHHQFLPLLPESELSARLYSVQGSGTHKQLMEQKEFSLLDVRRDGIHILQLPLEFYILIGPEARSRRKEIQSCIEVANSLVKETSIRRGSNMMKSPIHIVAFPSIPPRELKSAFRYWHDDHLNGKSWQRAGLGMNCYEREMALEQLNCNEWQLWQLNDEVFLPIGVGLEDVRGIDV